MDSNNWELKIRFREGAFGIIIMGVGVGCGLPQQIAKGHQVTNYIYSQPSGWKSGISSFEETRSSMINIPGCPSDLWSQDLVPPTVTSLNNLCLLTQDVAGMP